ncbi:microtubule cross-linking factor 2 isoform X3 [Brachyhypopomus gauderio]|uniref:microtubule cross-linking factor 2 isoform X3 n=1 Tax=Brachyhypopomus gauderio TaxID=698409 RepID=UPI004041247F
MTKTKVDAGSPSRLVSPKEKRLGNKMENGNQSGDGVQVQAQRPDQQPAVQAAQVNEKKKMHRAPSPARPKDVPGWSLTKIRGGIGAPTLSVKPGAIHLGGRVSRRSPVAGKESKADKGKLMGKSTVSSSGQKSNMKSNKPGRRKVSDASTASDDLSKDSGCAPGKLSPTDSSSELSDCASEENKLSTDAPSSDTETSSRGGPDGEKSGTEPTENDRNVQAEQRTKSGVDRLSLGTYAGEGSVSPGDERSLTSLDSRMPASTSLAFSDLTEELTDGIHEEYLREIEELRSENDYLKDEVEELRSEMLEMRDVYMEEDVYQLQDLRQQLDQANKTCRILQYRLRKAERRSLRVAQTGQVDGELIRTLEQDVKVAKDVSIRLHGELEAVEKKRRCLEQENEELQVKLQELEVAKQVLQAELERSRENSLKKRVARPNTKPDKKASPQPPEDSSDLKCQLHFAKEESALMCKKLTKMVKDNEAMKEELAKYHSLYGDVDSSLTVEDVADSPHTREAEVRVHLKLVEEEANLLSRRIVELEVENRGLRAEMDDMKIQETPGGLAVVDGPGQLLLSPSAESVMELQRHLQFVEEEAELLRRSLMEMEEQNKLLMNELNRYKSELPSDTEIESLSPSTILPPSVAPVAPPSDEGGPDQSEASQEELFAARLQIGELSGKVKKLQYENRVLLSNLQRCDLASNHGPGRPAMETDAEAGDSAECVPSPEHREGPVGGEGNQPLEEKGEKLARSDRANANLNVKDLLALREQALLVTSSINLLTPPTNSNCLLDASGDFFYRRIASGEAADAGLLEKNPGDLVEAFSARLQDLQAQLQALCQRLEAVEEAPERECVEGSAPGPLLHEDPCPAETQVNNITAQQKPNNRDQPEVKGHEAYLCKAEEESDRHTDSNKEQVATSTETSAALLSEQVRELQAQLSEARGRGEEVRAELALERQARRDHTHACSQKLSQLQDEHQKALVRCDFQLQSASLQTRLQQKLWCQERNLLVQEAQQVKQGLLLASLKLRWLLTQWRLGKKLDAEDVLEVNSVKDLHLLLEEDGISPRHGDNKMAAAEEQPFSSTTTKEHSRAEKLLLQQSGGFSTTLSDLKVALQDLSAELREERQSSQELTQQFARAKASWEVERTELKSLITQLEGKTTKTAVAGGEKDPPDLKGALKREREEHQHLLADSYAAVMDLTKQLQISERNWGREKLELLERFNQERNQWEQRLRDAQSKGSQSLQDNEKEVCTEVPTNDSALQRTKSISSLSDLESLLDTAPLLPGHEVNGITERKSGKHKFGDHASLLTPTDLSDINQKNWKYLSSEWACLEKAEPFKTWDCPTTTSCTSFPELELRVEQVQRSYTAPDKTGIRIYYSPPAVRRMERRMGMEQRDQEEPVGLAGRGGAISDPASLPATAASSVPSSYEQWLNSLTQQHRDLLEGRTGGLEISGNLSDDMKEMTNCVRQAIRSSSLERKCSKDAGSQTVGVASTGTQTAQFISVGLQTDGPASRGAGLHAKAWSPRPVSSLASARSRQISSSLEKVHGRIDRPCCSPKYGSPKLVRRVSTSSSKLETSSSSSRERSVWGLSNRGGSAWARSTTTRDSPVLSGLNDGLTSLFSVVDNAGPGEVLWKGDACPGRQPAGKPSCPSGGVVFGDVAARKYGIVHEFLRNVCGRAGPGEKSGDVDEPKPECLSGALIGTDSVTKIVNKRFMRQTQRDDGVVGGKESSNVSANTSSLEVSAQETMTRATAPLSPPHHASIAPLAPPSATSTASVGTAYKSQQHQTKTEQRPLTSDGEQGVAFQEFFATDTH